MTFWRTLVALALLTPQDRTAGGWGSVPDEQIAVLEEFYRATNGAKWRESSGWLTEDSPCEWHGIVCNIEPSAGTVVSNVVSIFLPDNDLTGVLPDSLASLPALESLFVSHNRLEGDVPMDLLTRWDNDELSFHGARNRFRNMIQRVRVVYEASGALCADDSDVRYVFDAQEYGPTRFESVRCNHDAATGTHCLIKEGNGPDLARLSRALLRLGYRSFEPEYWAAGTHQAFLTTTAWWGDGTEKTVMTYGGQGPLEVWIAQELFLPLMDDVYWESERFEPDCPSAKKD